MKKIIQIARLELSLLFYSPIAWLLMITLFVQMTIGFTAAIPELAKGGNFSFLTRDLFTNPNALGLLVKILDSLYLYIPLVTMGILSREISTGSIKLLYSSPVKLSQVVYGKFTAMLAYNLFIILVISLFVLAAAIFIPHFDFPHILVALFAAFLLLSAYSAIGIFVSSLTTYQAVAAISTFVLLAFMNYIGKVGQDLDVIRDLTHSLSMPSRATRMMAGLLNSRDVIYYLAISGMFLAFTITKLELERVSKSVLQQVSRYVVIVVVALMVTYVSSRQPMIAYYDATDTRENTITKTSQDILKKMGDEPIEVTTYVNGMEGSYWNITPALRISNISRWESYLRFKPNIKLKWVYYYDTIPGMTAGLAASHMTFDEGMVHLAKLQKFNLRDFLRPEQIKKQIDLSGENGRAVMQLKYKGKATFLRTFPPPDQRFWPAEEETGAALKRLMQPIPRIVFATDGYQRSIDKLGDRDYKTLTNDKLSRASMINQGFDIDTIALEHAEIPANIAVLVIGDPKVAYSTAAKAKLQKYITEGGNLVIAGEPGKQGVVNPLLESLGIKMLDGTLVQHSRDYAYDLVTPVLAAGSVAMDPGLQPFFQQKAILSMPGVAALSYQEGGAFAVHPLLMTDEQSSWIKKGKFAVDSAALKIDGKAGDEQGSFPPALMLSRQLKTKEQRIVISGDADFFSNGELGRSNMGTLNHYFAMRIFSWFSYGEFPVEAKRPFSKDNSTTLTKSSVKVIQVLYYGVIPGLMFLAGMMILIRRKRK
ncbi:Gldg family protein [Pedobacter caeni]|uniref:ABC-2 type transport system permease protein n=1 Tax=Pedobacter caeni TaxID=288992 RepID=A0A1M5A166_9SPHI|nr:Gldg family protein [Pedobacter caeni]SHF23944.1 ABC-2 type transport system permease protein [Pedobacter caeni]